MNVAVIIPAAGSASRYHAAGAVRHKLDEDLGGKPVLQRTVEVFTKFDSDEFSIGPIIVAGPHDLQEFAEFKERHLDRLGLLGARLVRGGRTHRWETVASALAELPAGDGLVAIHDGARPCMTHDLLDRVLRAARRFGGAVPAVAASDTIKRVVETDAEPEEQDRASAILGLAPATAGPQPFVAGTVPRTGLALAQTPQVFKHSLLAAAYAQVSGSPTDDAEVVEASFARSGGAGRIAIVEGSPRNIKITLPADLALARNILGHREPEGKPAHKRF
ncbi:MAG: 2-C-methyl-D-erythritol 4-phosphate cytidylyltransferase [Phycisphaerales bacterium]|nr:2-C-methyl-D-erythritol 4-phosphate cytidylyltransferase [Phycisphaerales bacterium]